MPDATSETWLESIGSSRVLRAWMGLTPERAFIGLDEAGKICRWDKAAEHLSGISSDEAMGRPLTSLLKATMEWAWDCAEQGSCLRSFINPQGTHHRIKVKRVVLDAQPPFAGGALEIWEALTELDFQASKAEQSPKGMTQFHKLLSGDEGMLHLFETCRQVAKSAAPVLVRGESGTGKELIAHALHAESDRAEKPFVAINCAALSTSLLESELFGHVRGAFTGAVREREGIFRQAHGGTLFLDEIAELPLELQAKLLRVLEAREVTPVGSERSYPVDVRIVSATHRSLRAQVAAGAFREDLMFRLRVVPLFLPPLRERQGDWERLLWYFLEQPKSHRQRRIESIEPAAYTALSHYTWPGNVRELRNVVDYTLAVGRGSTLKLQELPPELSERRAIPEQSVVRFSQELSETLEDVERRELAEALTRYPNLAEAAEALGMSRATLWRKRRRYGL